MQTTAVRREVPDFSACPDLVVIMLGMQVHTGYGLKTLLGLGKPIDAAVVGRPDRLLHYENRIIFSLRPTHIGMRWYWRDPQSLEAWSKSDPHRIWWRDFLRDSRGTGFWHETYHLRGGMEAVYVDIGKPVGFSTFMPMVPALGTMASRRRARAPDSAPDRPDRIA